MSKQVVVWFCVAGVALRDILMCLQTGRKSFCVAGAIPLRRFQKMSCIFYGKRSTLETSIVILRGRRSIWFGSVVCGMLFCAAGAVFPTLHTLHFTLCTLHSTLYTLHSTLYSPHFTLYTPYFTLDTPDFTLRTLHFTLYTLHSTLYILHSTL